MRTVWFTGFIAAAALSACSLGATDDKTSLKAPETTPDGGGCDPGPLFPDGGYVGDGCDEPSHDGGEAPHDAAWLDDGGDTWHIDGGLPSDGGDFYPDGGQYGGDGGSTWEPDGAWPSDGGIDNPPDGAWSSDGGWNAPTDGGAPHPH